jgi:hypothetical protein
MVGKRELSLRGSLKELTRRALLGDELSDSLPYDEDEEDPPKIEVSVTIASLASRILSTPRKKRSSVFHRH